MAEETKAPVKAGPKTYKVRDGFVYQNPVKTANGGTTLKEYEAGETLLAEFPADAIPHQLEEVAG